MFGYIRPDLSRLDKEQKARYRRCYCGVCDSLHDRYGLPGRVTLSYDMTFLALLLDALYEEDEARRRARCPVHVFRGVDLADSAYADYAADMNIALSYYKLLDNWQDDGNILSHRASALLERCMASLRARYPEQLSGIDAWIEQMNAVEKQPDTGIDISVNLTGEMLAKLFAYGESPWKTELLAIGNALGRFIYLMDAYEDLNRDARKGSFNPLIPIRERDDFDAFCIGVMESMMADCVRAFEILPIVRNADLLRNVLYSGVWSQLRRMKRDKHKKEEGAK